ncbi:hypothetical protein C8F04DRAFT_1184934 [Mycena alexandri]|uniref:Uncharacterized protein n=1 Tax=Mycena alexandri TaxID=1745969 RepID=A0AAD6SRS4_9AGAR|nr:hypothetical protein C8F04DRAFT_1184934 [Mycena alexandri]
MIRERLAKSGIQETIFGLAPSASKEGTVQLSYNKNNCPLAMTASYVHYTRRTPTAIGAKSEGTWMSSIVEDTSLVPVSDSPPGVGDEGKGEKTLQLRTHCPVKLPNTARLTGLERCTPIDREEQFPRNPAATESMARIRLGTLSHAYGRWWTPAHGGVDEETFDSARSGPWIAQRHAVAKRGGGFLIGAVSGGALTTVSQALHTPWPGSQETLKGLLAAESRRERGAGMGFTDDIWGNRVAELRNECSRHLDIADREDHDEQGGQAERWLSSGLRE